MTAVKAANGTNITRYGYNTLNQLTSMTDPEGGIERYYYDVRGNMTAKTLRSGTVIGYKYDAANRLIKESSNSAIKSSIEYNRSKDGMLTKTETNPNGVITTTIDKYGRTKSRDVTSNGQTYGICFNYNEQNLVGTKYIYKKSGTNNTYYGSYKYNYDAKDRLSQVVDTENNKNETIVSYTYDANDNVNTVRNANGTTTEYTYNFANLVISMKNKKGSNILSSYEYKYNYDGTQYYKKDHTGRTDTYTYDNLGRLTSESVTGVSNATRIDYTYDPAGNRTRMVESGNSIQTMTIDYTYSHSNKLLKEAAKEDGADNTVLTYYNYDTNGNLTSKVVSEVFDEDSSGLPRLKINTEAEYLSRYQNNFTKTRLEYYNYNVFNQLVSYSNSKGTKASYTYMPDGLRASKTVGGIKTNEVWDGQNVIMEVNSNNEISKFYEYGLDMVREKNSKTYYNYNAHGDVVQLTNQNGTVTQDYTYDAFGNQKSATNVDNPFRYCGEYYDNETGLIYLRNRYYNLETGRFINEDPIKDGVNWYVYCSNNPLIFIDPSGLGFTNEDIEAYNSGKMSKSAYNLLTEATNEWNNADPHDYTTLAEARQKAVAARRSYNPNYVDDFDYTFGTGASAIDDGSAGLFMKTAKIVSKDGNMSGLVRLTYKRIIKDDHPYLQVVSACGYSTGSESKKIYTTKIDVSIGQSSGILPDVKRQTFNSSTFYIMSGFDNSTFDDKKSGVVVVGCDVTFYYSNGSKMSITNNVDCNYYTFEDNDTMSDADFITIGNATDYLMTRNERLNR